MFTFYGIAIAITSWILRIFVQLSFVVTVSEELFIDIMITICSRLSTIAEVHKLVCKFQVTSFSS